MLSFVATMNSGFSRYWSTVKIDANEEMGTKIHNAMKDAIEEYIKENNGAVPKRVIVFRDGVSRFALKNVKSSEIKGIRLAFEEIAAKHGTTP